MKKNLYTSVGVLVFMLCTQLSFSQMDTLLHEDFQVDNTDEMALFPDGPDTDTLWVNFDFDQIDAANNFPSNWVWDLDWNSPDSIPVADSNFVLVSRSWLTNYDTSSSNWLVTPAIEIVDDQATFHWKSAPFQGPRYMDGYSIKVMDNSSFFDADYIDVKFRAAEMEGWIGDSGSTDPDSFLFGPGYVHANYYMDSIYFVPPDVDSSGAVLGDLNVGVLEPHSISLAEYAGQTIFIAIHHDSADDNLLQIDDLLVLGTAPGVSSTNNIDEFDLRFVTYPNPVDHYLNVMYRLKEKGTVQVQVVNQTGKIVRQLPVVENALGEYNHHIDLKDLPAGNYNVVLNVDGQFFTRKLFKK